MSDLNPNLYSLAKWRIMIPELSDTNFFAKAITLPDITLAGVRVPTPTPNNMFVAGDKIEYGNLIFTMLVQEDLKNYIEIFSWVKRNLTKNQTEYKDITVEALNNNYLSNIKMKFTDCWPSNQSPLNLDYASDENETPTVDVVLYMHTMSIIDADGNEY